MSSAPGSQRTDPLGLIGRTVDERYEILELVDEGGYGLIYKARRVMWDTPVAVKFIKQRHKDPEKRKRAAKAFIAEGAVLNELSRKTTAILQSLDIGTLHRGDAGELLYMALEWLEGTTLQKLMDAERAESDDPKWPLERVIDTLQPIAVGLAVAHGSGVAHRDIKPSNIFLVEESGSVEATTKLLDFGVAKVVEDRTDGFEETGHKDNPYTPKYGAPEQFAKRHGATGPWSDVYALAMVCVELLAGKYPLGAQGFGSLIFAVCDPDKRPTPRAIGVEVSDEVEAVFARALCVKSDDRYRDAGLFWRALLEAAGISASTFPVPVGGRSATMKNPPSIERFTTPPPPASTVPPPQNRPWWYVGVGVAALIGTLVGGAFLVKSEEDRTTVATPTVTSGAPTTSISREQLASFGALPEAMTTPENPLTPAKIDLGRMLFYDERLSKNADVSCNSCHRLEQHGVDGKRVSTGTGSQPGHRNSPTVYHAAGAVALMWDGRAETIESQAMLPLTNPKEHGLSEGEIVERLEGIDGYEEAFRAAFPDRKPTITVTTVGLALGAFQRKLVTPSRWDDFIAGDRGALREEEKRGFNVFMRVGCPTCHAGPYLGLSMSQKLGLIHPWPHDLGAGGDRGLFEETKRPEHMMVFRVPTLRNVVDTGPYLHDGSMSRLDEVVRLMAYHQLGKEISADEVKAIVAWLTALSGKLPAAYIDPPELPR